MKKLLLLFCILNTTVGGLVAQTLRIDVTTSTLFPAVCDSDVKQPLRFEIIYHGPTIPVTEHIGIKYNINGVTFNTIDSTTVDSLHTADSIPLNDTIITSTSQGFNVSGVEDIVVIWPTGSGGIAIVGDSIADTTMLRKSSGIAYLNASSYITLSPNPAQNVLYLNYSTSSIRLEQVRICNMLGQQVLVKNSSFNVIDITTLPDGFYLFEATTTDKSHCLAQFVKTH